MATSLSSPRIFGTDGVRGIANVEPMTVETAVKLGRAAAYVFHRDQRRHRIVIGKDTRLSCYMIENAMVAGICSMGVDALLVGPLPTPGVAFITRSLRADAGVVISASHNLYQDNGIKFFGADGYKLAREVEQRMEHLIATGELDQIRPTATDVGKAYRIDDALGRYVEYAKQTFPKGMTLEGLRIAVDCAHGAAYKAAPCILRELGADVHVINSEPDGVNINDHCGSMYPAEIRKAVIECHADVGIALDGDADRVIMTDENAREVDGDMMLAVIALDWQQHGLLRNNMVVSTTIGNLGVEHFLQQHDIRMVRADVGDRNVIYAMREYDAALGGEPCGHIVVQQVSTTGDGMMAALQVLAAMRHNDMALSRLCKDISMYPSLSANVPAGKKPPLETCATLQTALAAAQRQLGARGRIVVRYSGTEPKLRITVEGDDNREIQALLRQLCDAARADLGA